MSVLTYFHTDGGSGRIIEPIFVMVAAAAMGGQKAASGPGQRRAALGHTER